MTPKKADDYLLNDPFRISTPERLLIDKNCSKRKCTFIIHLAIIFFKNYLYPKHWAMGICILYDNNWGWNLAGGRQSVHSLLSSSVSNTECHILRLSVRAQRLTRHVPCIWTANDSESDSCSVMSISLATTMHSSFLCPWDSPGKNTGVGCHSLLGGIFLTQRSNPGLLHCGQIHYCPSHQRS